MKYREQLNYAALWRWTLLGGLALSSSQGRGQDFWGVDLFIEACRHQGLNPAQMRSGYAEFELEVKTQPLTEAEIQQNIEQEIAAVRRVIAMAKNDLMRQKIEKTLDDVPSRVRAHSRGVKLQKMKVLFRGNDVRSGDRRQEIVRFDPVTDMWDPTPDIIMRRGVEKGADSVLWQPAARLAMVLGEPASIDEFQEFGRVQGEPCRFATALLLRGADALEFQFTANGIALLKSKAADMERSGGFSAYRLAGNATYDSNAVARIVESSMITGGKSHLLQRYWIDPDRGYVCPLVELYDDSGSVTERWRSSQYFLHESSGLWFPAIHIHSTFVRKVGQDVEERTYRLNPRTFQLNQAVGDEEFAIQLPKGAAVLDTRATEVARYKVIKPASLCLSRERLDLRSTPGVALVTASTTRNQPNSFLLEWLGSLSWKYWLAAVNGLILIALLGVFARRIIQARRSERA